MNPAIITPSRRLIVPIRGVRKPARPVLDPRHPINRGLIACLLLGDVPVGLTRDISGNGRQGATSGSPVLRPGHHGGQSLGFDASGTQWVQLGNSNSFLNWGAGDRAISVWFYATTVDANFRRPVSFPVDDTGNDTPAFTIAVQSSAGGFIAGFGGSPFAGYVVWTGSANKWYHVVTSITGNLVTVWLNGALLGSATNTSTGATSPLGYVGRYNASFPLAVFGGYVEGLRVWNRTVSAAEALSLYVEPYAGVVENAPRWRVGVAAGGGVVPQPAKLQPLNMALWPDGNWTPMMSHGGGWTGGPHLGTTGILRSLGGMF